MKKETEFSLRLKKTVSQNVSRWTESGRFVNRNNCIAAGLPTDTNNTASWPML
jgi:hypothetical protein